MHRVDRAVARVGAGLAPLALAGGWLIGWAGDPGQRLFVPPAARAASTPPATIAPRTFEVVAPTPVRPAPRPNLVAAPTLSAPSPRPAATTTAAAPTSTAPVTTTPPSTPTSSTPTATPTKEASTWLSTRGP